MLADGKYIFRNFYKISPIQKTGHEKVSRYFAPETVTVIQTEKTAKIFALDIEDHLSANMQAAEESRLVLGAE